MIIVINASQLTFSPIRAIQTVSSTSNQVSWIEYSKLNGQVRVFLLNRPNPIITLNSLRPDLAQNQAYIFISLRGNQLASFYNCYITDAIMLNDSTITSTFLSFNTLPVYGQAIFNRNLNDVFSSYGCVNKQDAYQQIFAQTNNLVKDYCQLTLNDLQKVNVQMTQLIDNITNDKKSNGIKIDLISSNLEYCTKKKF